MATASFVLIGVLACLSAIVAGDMCKLSSVAMAVLLIRCTAVASDAAIGTGDSSYSVITGGLAFDFSVQVHEPVSVLGRAAGASILRACCTAIAASKVR